ncbi:hypothetical protein [Taibaiella koreensis]|uniref:hypothetical protein n=1 Tax=Taibaiella koreensis TaxID=1268548 RepID=UPI0013C305CC|nr:hypothetical protein [Taibaiella koreensis]
MKKKAIGLSRLRFSKEAIMSLHRQGEVSGGQTDNSLCQCPPPKTVFDDTCLQHCQLLTKANCDTLLGPQCVYSVDIC